MEEQLNDEIISDKKHEILPIITQEEVKKIRKDIIQESIYQDLKHNTVSKTMWKKIGDFTETIAHIFIIVGSILSFASGFYKITHLSFVAGCCGVATLSLSRFSSYAMKESSERTIQVNKLLEKIGIEKIPDIVIDSSTKNDI